MMGDLYLWLKTLHIFFFIAWMAGMLYLPRLFVYHADAEKGSKQSKTFKVMERRLLRGIMNPSMIGVWVVGFWMAINGGWMVAGWLHAKLALVLAMSAVHGMFSKWRKDFEADRNARPASFYRMWNEVPAVILIAIIVLVVIKPF
jgi:protoporphyrinogen IX oxidase